MSEVAIDRVDVPRDMFRCDKPTLCLALPIMGVFAVPLLAKDNDRANVGLSDRELSALLINDEVPLAKWDLLRLREIDLRPSCNEPRRCCFFWRKRSSLDANVKFKQDTTKRRSNRNHRGVKIMTNGAINNYSEEGIEIIVNS